MRGKDKVKQAMNIIAMTRQTETTQPCRHTLCVGSFQNLPDSLGMRLPIEASNATILQYSTSLSVFHTQLHQTQTPTLALRKCSHTP